MTTSAPVPALDRDMIARLRADVITSSWTTDTLDELLSDGALSALMRDSRLPALVELAGVDAPAATLTRFFIGGQPERASALDAALPTLGAAGLETLGLAATIDEDEAASALVMPRPCSKSAPKRERAQTGEGEEASFPTAPALPTMRDPDEEPEPEVVVDPWMRALYDLRPHAAALPGGEREWWVTSDLGEGQTGKPLADHHVMGIGGATRTLLEMTVRDQVDSALDVGCGCGIQALYLATHARRVVATDVSARACALTQFNAALNETTIDVREGSLFEPVEGETFDLIVTNPPFVITPDTVRCASGMHEYRDGGMDRDNLIAAVLRGAPDCMTPGGTLQMLANWEIPESRNPDTQWSQRIDEWTACPWMRGWSSVTCSTRRATWTCGSAIRAARSWRAPTTSAPTRRGWWISVARARARSAWASWRCAGSTRPRQPRAAGAPSTCPSMGTPRVDTTCRGRWPPCVARSCGTRC